VFFPVIFFSIELPKSFKIFEGTDHLFLFRYDTPVLIAKNKEQLFELLNNNSEIIEFWKDTPSIILEYSGPEDFREEVLSVIQNLGISVGYGSKMRVRLRLSGNYVLMELSYDSLSLNNYSSLSELENWKKDLEKLIKKILKVSDANVPHVVLVKTLGNTIKYKDEIKNDDFLIFTYSKNIELEILENQRWKKLTFEIKNPADLIKLNYFNVEFQTIPDRAKLFVDNDYIGEAPSIIKLKGGIHSIRIELSGYKSLNKRIYVDRNQTLKYTLDRLDKGNLFLNLNVLEATVTIDSKTYKIEDGKLSVDLEPGIHNLEIRSKNRESFHKNVYLNSNETKELNVKLKGIVGREDWTIFVNIENIGDIFYVSYNELILWQKDGSLICMDTLRKELFWSLENFENIIDIYKYRESYLVVCEDSLQLIREGKKFLLLKLENESFISWDFKNLIFATNSGKIYKLSNRTFQILWTRKEYPLLSILSKNDSIVMFDVFRNIYCYDVRTMSLIWKNRFKNVVSIFQSNNQLYLSTGRSIIVSDLETGREIERINFKMEMKNILFLGNQTFVAIKNSLKSLKTGKVINCQGQVYSDNKNIYILDGKNLNIYFMDKGKLNLKTVVLPEKVEKIKIGDGAVILIYKSGKISKVFGKDGY